MNAGTVGNVSTTAGVATAGGATASHSGFVGFVNEYYSIIMMFIALSGVLVGAIAHIINYQQNKKRYYAENRRNETDTGCSEGGN